MDLQRLGEENPENKIPGPPGWRLGVGPPTLPRKTNLVKETETTRNRMDSQMKAFSMKRTTRTGCWNVRTLREQGKLRQLINEAQRYKIEILGVSEVGWGDFGETDSEQTTFLYSGRSNEEQYLNGVGILLTKKAKESLLSWQPISDRRFQTPVKPCTIIQRYAPTEPSEMEHKIKFYDELNKL
jgi:hypothetical protein